VPAARNAFAGCDCLLAVGTRFGELATGSFGVAGAGEPGACRHQPAGVQPELSGGGALEGDAAAVLGD
jgi:acetolactate synthase-1/2/3 large subunit